MSTSAKALSLANDLADELKKRTTLTVAQSFDTDGSPLIQVGTGSIGAAGGLLKVRPQDWPLAKDVLGLSANIYTPHVIQLVTEANASAGAGADINTPAQLMVLMAPALLRGCRFEWYNSANGNAPDATDITSGNLKASFESLYHPLTSNS